jgi:hypothetical protein
MPYLKTIKIITNMHMPIVALWSTTISVDLTLPSTIRPTNNTMLPSLSLQRYMGSTKLFMRTSRLNCLIHRRSVIFC